MNGKRVLVFGATGNTGRQITAGAIARGHQVTAFVRRPERLGETDQRLAIVKGDVTTDLEVVARAIRGQEVVISSLGRGLSLRSHGLIAQSVRIVVPIMEREGVRRLIFISAFGVGDSFRDAPPFMRLMFRVMLHSIYADKAIGEETVRGSTLDWTLVQPVQLTSGPRSGYRAGERLPIRGFLRVSRADVADFIVEQVGDPTFLRKAVVIAPQ